MIICNMQHIFYSLPIQSPTTDSIQSLHSLCSGTSLAMGAALSGATSCIPLLLRAGSAALMDPRCFHCGSSNYADAFIAEEGSGFDELSTRSVLYLVLHCWAKAPAGHAGDSYHPTVTYDTIYFALVRLMIYTEIFGSTCNVAKSLTLCDPTRNLSTNIHSRRVNAVVAIWGSKWLSAPSFLSALLARTSRYSIPRS